MYMEKNLDQRPSIPEGLRDILPAEAKERRRLETRLRDRFEERGYGEVICPTFEFYDLLSVEAGPAVKRDMVRFMGSDGRLLALRPEMTTTIARVVAQRLDTAAGPHRLYYVANVFREEFSKQGRVREFRQAGIELIGLDGVEADIEAVAIFIEALSDTGLSDFQVGLGQIGFLEGAIASLDIAETDRDRLRSALAERSQVAYEKAVTDLGLAGETARRLLAIPTLRGGAEVLEASRDLAVGPQSLVALERLKAVFGGLTAAGLADNVVLDFGIWRGFDYYTGLIFEAYAPGVGLPVGAGGRYDKLLAEFGRPAPAAGFALGLDRLQLALAKSSPAGTGAGA